MYAQVNTKLDVALMPVRMAAGAAVTRTEGDDSGTVTCARRGAATHRHNAAKVATVDMAGVKALGGVTCYILTYFYFLSHV